MLLLKLAFLNIGRNPRRSLITILAVAVGLAALIFLWAFSEGTSETQRENVIRLFTGHFQIHAKDFDRTLSPELTLPNREQILSKIQNIPGVIAYSERVKCEALIGTTENSRGILLMGIDPEKEPQVTQFKNHINEGMFLETGGDRDILIGDRLAKKMQITLGDKVVLMTQSLDGTLAGYSYHVKGIFKTGSQQIDEQSAYITLSSAKELVGTDENTHEVVIRLESRKAIASAISYLRSNLNMEQTEILRWDEIVPEVEQWAKWADAVISTILVAVVIVIGVGIMNTVLMSVFERTKELGVMLAIGTSPNQLMALILLETIVLQVLGIMFGLILGFFITSYFHHAGIHFRGVDEAFSMSYMSTVIYPVIKLKNVIDSVVLLLTLSSFIGLYPAWRAGKMEPVKAIYHS